MSPHPDLVGSRGLGRGGQAVGGDGLVMVAIGDADAVAALLAAAAWRVSEDEVRVQINRPDQARAFAKVKTTWLVIASAEIA